MTMAQCYSGEVEGIGQVAVEGSFHEIIDNRLRAKLHSQSLFLDPALLPTAGATALLLGQAHDLGGFLTSDY